MLRHAAVTDAAWLLFVFKVAQRGNDPGSVRLAAVCTFNHNNASKLHPEQVQRHEPQIELSALTKLVTHYSAACVCLWSGLHSHCPNSDWPKKKKGKKKKAAVSSQKDCPTKSLRHSPPRRCCLLWSLLFQIRWRLQSESVNLISQQGGREEGEDCFPSALSSLSVFSPSTSHCFSSSSSTAPISPGWAPSLPRSHSNQNSERLTLPTTFLFHRRLRVAPVCSLIPDKCRAILF